jgi:predicted ferric reductase/Ca2+-binding EF-hand superfamily protein
VSSRIPPVDARLLASLERAFRRHAGDDARIDPGELQKALGLRSEYLARRVFAAFDRNGDGTIDRDEFLEGARALVSGTDREKLAFAFRVHDHDGDGFLDRQELLRMIAISLAESDVARATQPPEQLTKVLFAMADRDGDGRISLDELEAAVRKRPELLARMTRSEATWILPNEDLLGRLEPRARRRRSFSPEAGWLPLVFLALWLVGNAAIFVAVYLRAPAGPTPSALMQVGRATGSCIDFDGALILVPMMSRLLARLRASWLGRMIPIDDAVAFHRIVGHALFALAIAHAAAFVAAYVTGHAATPLPHLLFATERGVTGVSLLVVFAIMWSFALGPIRRSSRFELFYFTHLLYVAWLALAIAHAPSFLVLGGVPLIGFAVEQLLRRSRRTPLTSVVSSVALRSGVVRLEVARPPGFAFSAGDYAFLRLPELAKHEWHPFTISSAPEDDTLTFHVRSLGNWTSALRRRAESGPEGLTSVAYVDGPYGSPSAHIFRSKVAVLIGAGIGVTPFASVLESIARRAGAGRPSSLEKVHFFWLNRDQYSFEWFVALLAELESGDRTGLLDFHLCMTDGRAGITAMGLELSREAMRAAGRSDLITGLRMKTHLGQPSWELLLGVIASQHAPTRPDVFFCGPPGLARKLRPLCVRLGMSFREERF